MSQGPQNSEQMTEDTDGPQKPKSNVIWFVVIATAIIVFAIRNFEMTKNILLVLLGFGAVVIVHEFGHFVVAKLCGIKVEAFSLFMPPTLFGIKKADRGWRIRVLPEIFKNKVKEGEKPDEDNEGLYTWTVGKKLLPGETEYRIGLIPLGGFVKMLGQEDVGPVKENKDPRSFANKPALARAAVLAAGVSFNVISAVIAYIVVFSLGIGLLGPIVGGVLPGSPADKAGIKAGDEVLEVAGQDGRLDFSDIAMGALLSGKDKEIPLKVKHEDGSIEEVNLTAEKLPGMPYRSFGIDRPLTLTIAKLDSKDANDLMKNTGLMPGDKITAVDGEDVSTNWQFEKMLDGRFEPYITLRAERKEQSVEGHLNLGYPAPVISADENEQELSNICGMVPRMRIIAVSNTFNNWFKTLLHLKEKGEMLKAGDIITAVGEIENPTYSEMRAQTKENKNKKLNIKVVRSEPNGVQKFLTVETTPKEEDSNRVVIGIMVELDAENAVVAKTIATPNQPEELMIPRGARITAVDGVEVNSFFEVARELKKNAGQKVAVDWRLDEQKAGDVAIEVGQKDKIVTAQAIPKEVIPFKQLERMYKADGPIDAIKMGYKRTKIFIVQSYVTLQRLVSGLVSTKELMGPVGILTVSYKIVADQPIIYYVYFLGLISASLAVLNFMPMPPLDGGLTLLLIIEKIKGSPISIRTQEIIAYIGWGLVLMLLLYVTFNDIARIAKGFFGF